MADDHVVPGGTDRLQVALTVEQQVARAVAALRQAIRGNDLLAPEDPETRQEWVVSAGVVGARQTFSIKKGIDPPSDLVAGMSPELGKSHYRILSGPVHGGVLSLMRRYEAVMESPEDRRAEDWFPGDLDHGAWSHGGPAHR